MHTCGSQPARCIPSRTPTNLNRSPLPSPPPPCACQACNRQNLYCVPLYDSLGEHAIEFIIKHAEATCVFTQSDKFGTLAKSLPHVRGCAGGCVVLWSLTPAAHSGVGCCTVCLVWACRMSSADAGRGGRRPGQAYPSPAGTNACVLICCSPRRDRSLLLV